MSIKTILNNYLIDNHVGHFMADIETIQFSRGDVIFKENDLNIGVYVLENGLVKRSIRGGNGRESIFAFCGISDYFGQRSILSKERNFDSAICTRATTAHLIPRASYLKIIDESKSVLADFITSIGEESIDHIRRCQILSQLTLKQRTAYALLYIQSKNAEKDLFNIYISRDDLSSFVGTVNESVVRILHGFKKDNIITSSGRLITILKPDELRLLSKV